MLTDAEPKTPLEAQDQAPTPVQFEVSQASASADSAESVVMELQLHCGKKLTFKLSRKAGHELGYSLFHAHTEGGAL